MANRNISRVIEDIDKIVKKKWSSDKLFVVFNDWWYNNKTTRLKLKSCYAKEQFNTKKEKFFRIKFSSDILEDFVKTNQIPEIPDLKFYSFTLVF